MVFHQDIYTFRYKLCENGHMIYSSSGDVTEEFCQICGAALISECQKCSAPLPKSFQSPVFFGSGEPVYPPSKPGACSKCGSIFPWALSLSTPSRMSDMEAVAAVCRCCSRFHTVVRQLRNRYDGREPLDVEDEYDVQDLLKALLSIHFDDIRPEEWTPSYAGGSSRVDFLIKPYMILVEVKKTRNGLNSRMIGNHLIEDIARYKQIEGCKTMICFIYDPEERINNPKGLISDLERLDQSVKLKVIISPLNE